MNTLSLLLALLLVTGSAIAGPLSAKAREECGGYSWSEQCWREAVATLPNRDEVMARYEAAQDKQIIIYLAQRSEKQLTKHLETLARGTNTHPWTKAQLEAALALRAERAAKRAEKKLTADSPPAAPRVDNP